MNELKIYSASAGSGKTHRLTGNVLNTLILNPDEYKYILAVTFTRKASEEMKTRILHELYLLSSDNKSDFLQEITINTKFSEQDIRIRAKTVLTKILHHYSRFSYSTIDSFFQSIHRAFLREANIHSQFELQLDTKMVAEKSVNLMLNEIESDVELKQNLLQLIDNQIKSSQNWQIKQKLTELYNEVFKEPYNNLKISPANVFDIVKIISEYCYSTINIIEQKNTKLKNELEKILNDIGLSTDDFKGKSKSIPRQLLNRFDNFIAPSNTIIESCNDETKWIANNDKNQSKISPILNSIMLIANRYCSHYYDNISLFNTCILVRNNLYYLGLTIDARHRIDNYLKENNEYLLSDVTDFLAALTENNDSPFVYEKTGAFVNHYLIDEFQDTSNKQWLALKPLMIECLSHINNQGMIVGDVKQSIYRWRNGNWKLLGQEVPEYFNAIPIVMNDNWRSRKNIVKFNNTIFDALVPLFEKFIVDTLEKNNHSELLSDYEGMFAKNYSDIKQNIKKGKGGIVEINFFDGKKDEYRELALCKCVEQIENLQQKGVSPGDIAILVRKNKDGQQVARFLLDYGRSSKANQNISYRIVSNEALRLNSSYTVNIIIGLLKYFANNEDISSLIQAIVLYQKYYKQNSKVLSEVQIETDKDKLISLLHNDIKLLNNIAKQFPLFELSERLIKILELDDDKDAIPFLEAFADVCSTFQSKYDSGLDAFIEWWNINSDKQSLQLPDDPDAIKILTIHKSKGLGFGYVIIPFCDWSFVPNPTLTMVWCSTQIKPFSKLNAYPLKCSSSLVNSFFFKDYFEEYFNTIFDNLNMLYVAFTRAKNGLFISAPNEPHSHTNISNYLYAALQQELKAADNVFQEFSNFKSDDNSWKIGDIDEEKLYLQHKTGDAAYPVFIPNKNIKIKNWFEKFDNNIPIKNGLIYHKIFENITDINSVQNALNMAFADGIISQSKAKELLSEISFKLSSGLPKIWFSKYEKLFSERSLLLPKGEFLRPDRVMKFDKSWAVVDYKFGKKMDNKHIQQVDKYAEIIESITGERVDAYVWYFFEDKIINVKEQEKIL